MLPNYFVINKSSVTYVANITKGIISYDSYAVLQVIDSYLKPNHAIRCLALKF